MQLTGHGSTHNSHPVHSSWITVCICLAAPKIASTGQARIQSVHPMQSSSLIIAVDFGLMTPYFLFNGLFRSPGNSAAHSILVYLFQASIMT